MADALTNVTTFINSPPGQLVAGGLLVGIVWRFFERVEAVLNDGIKLEIAMWLLGVREAARVQSWPSTFGRIFDSIFSTQHVSWFCFKRSLLVTYVLTALATLGQFFLPWSGSLEFESVGQAVVGIIVTLVIFPLLTSVIPAYISLLKSRYALTLAAKAKSSFGVFFIGLADAAMSLLLGLTTLLLGAVWMWMVLRLLVEMPGVAVPPLTPSLELYIRSSLPQALTLQMMKVLKGEVSYSAYLAILPPFFFTSIWIWLYVGSGFLLKTANHFILGFQWFNAKFGIEKRPLQSIGLIAGALVAIVYWAAVIVIWL